MGTGPATVATPDLPELNGERVRQNHLLSDLPEAERKQLYSVGDYVSLERNQIVVTPRREIESIYFPFDGIFSIIGEAKSPTGAEIEIGLFGNEGMSSGLILLSNARAVYKTIVQVDCRRALRINARSFIDKLPKMPSLHRKLLSYIDTQMVQTSENAMANVSLKMEARLGRWLLMCHDRVVGDDVRLTHNFMAVMVGAHRTGITASLHLMEGEGMIRSTRGCVTILDRDKIRSMVGTTYGKAEERYTSLIGGFGK